MKTRTITLITLILLILLSACGAKPAGEWIVSSPEAQNMDPETIEAMFQALEDDPRSEVHSVLILRNDVVVAEKYFNSYDEKSLNMLYSVTKSFTSTLVGMAIEEGFIKSVDQPVSDFFPEAVAASSDSRIEAMRLEDLLTMRAGLDWREGNPAYRSLYYEADWVAFMLKKPMVADPGSEFNYCSGCSHVLSGVVRKATGMLTQEYAETRLFAPLGISNYTWETDAQGNAIGGWGLELTARDMAKFGSLFLNGGRWNGKQVVPAGWVEKATSPGLPSDGEWNYAYQWWAKPAEKLYAAQGLHGQKIYVVPDLKLVVVVTAGADDSSAAGDLVLNAAIAASK